MKIQLRPEKGMNVRKKIEVEAMNVVLVNGEKR